jgi:hypothetical protein
MPTLRFAVRGFLCPTCRRVYGNGKSLYNPTVRPICSGLLDERHPPIATEALD